MAFAIYPDHNSTTPILPEVLEAIMPYLTTEWGNSSSTYKFGSKLKSVIATGREQVAELIGADSLGVIFTSCGSESNNAAIAAALRANPGERHIVTSQVEHSSVLDFCMALEKEPGSTTPAQRAHPSSSEEGSPLGDGVATKAPLLIQEGPRGSAGVVTGSPYRLTCLPIGRQGLLMH
jgi:hypothetical protein